MCQHSRGIEVAVTVNAGIYDKLNQAPNIRAEDETDIKNMTS